MERNTAKTAAKSITSLFWAKVVSYSILSIGTILIARLLTPSEFGLVNIALIIPGVLNIFEAGGWGTGDAITKYIAETRSGGGKEKIGSIIYTGFLFRLLLSTVLTMTGYLTASYFTINVFQKAEAASLATLASLLVFTGSMYTFVFSVFMGFEKMHYNGVIIVCSNIIKSFLLPVLLIAGYGTTGVIIGYIVASLLPALIGIILILYLYKKRKLLKKGNFSLKLLRTMLRYGLPLALGSFLTFGFAQYNNFLMGIHAPVDDIGNLAQALKFAVLTEIVVDPIMITLFPMFSKLNNMQGREMIRKTFDYSVKYSTLVLVPICMWTMVLSKPLTLLLLGEEYTKSWLYLSLMAIGWLYVGLGMMPLTQLFTGLGDTRLVIKLNIITIIIGMPIAYLIIPIYGVVGWIITGLIVPWPTFFYAIRKGKEKYGVKIPLKQVTRVYMASIFSTIPIIALTMLNLDYLVTLVLGGVIGVCLYLFLAPKLRAIDRDDVAMLASTLGTLPILGKLIVKILSLEEKLF